MSTQTFFLTLQAESAKSRKETDKTDKQPKLLIIMYSQLLFFQNLGSTELIIIAFVVLLLFGGKKIPELMRGLGKGVSQFKKGMNYIEQELNAEPEKSVE